MVAQMPHVALAAQHRRPTQGGGARHTYTSGRPDATSCRYEEAFSSFTDLKPAARTTLGIGAKSNDAPKL
jgi:hypothetical protein